MKGLRWAALGVVIVLALGLAAAAFASSGTGLDWWVIAGGGGGASGGSVALDGTLGQPAAGVSTGGSTALCAGYWCSEQPVRLFLPMLRH